jgi:hypothetical protein
MREPRPPARRPRRGLTIAFVLIAAIATSGCSQTVAGTAAHVCETWRSVSISKHDKLSDQTAKEIAGNNAARETWCKGAPS